VLIRELAKKGVNGERKVDQTNLGKGEKGNVFHDVRKKGDENSAVRRISQTAKYRNSKKGVSGRLEGKK